jgi:hypothetical protein
MADRLTEIEQRLREYSIAYNDDNKGLHYVSGAAEDTEWLITEMKRLRSVLTEIAATSFYPDEWWIADLAEEALKASTFVTE